MFAISQSSDVGLLSAPNDVLIHIASFLNKTDSKNFQCAVFNRFLPGCTSCKHCKGCKTHVCQCVPKKRLNCKNSYQHGRIYLLDYCIDCFSRVYISRALFSKEFLESLHPGVCVVEGGFLRVADLNYFNVSISDYQQKIRMAKLFNTPSGEKKYRFSARVGRSKLKRKHRCLNGGRRRLQFLRSFSRYLDNWGIYSRFSEKKISKFVYD